MASNVRVQANSDGKIKNESVGSLGLGFEGNALIDPITMLLNKRSTIYNRIDIVFEEIVEGYDD